MENYFLRFKHLLFFSVLICNLPLVIAQENTNTPVFNTQKAFANLDFLSIKMPDENEVNMGFSGIHYNLKFKDFYTGLGIYGSVSGIRGGFFTLGVNAGIQKKITESLFVDTGIHFGGGGGGGAPDGGGAFILPHLSFGYQFSKFSLSGGYSYVNFFDDGEIKSDQFYISLQVPISFDYANYLNAEKKYSTSSLKGSLWEKISNRISVMAHLNNLSPMGDSRNNLGVSLNDKTIRLSGVEINAYLTKNWFWLFKTDGAYSGIPAGYMDVFLGGGYHFSMNKNRTNLLGKFAIGAGGGGGVDSQGGALLYPDLSIEQKIYEGFYVSINKGFMLSPNQHFNASTLGFGLKYYVNTEGTLSDQYALTKTKFKGLNIIIKQDVYTDAKRVTNPTEDLYQISLQVDLFLKKHIYATGQTSFANFGNAGAYAEGILGVGIQSAPIFQNKISVFGQALAGAAGGGNISTGQGLILKPSAGIYYHLTDQLNLRAAAGYVKASGGDLSNASFNFGLSYRFSLLTAK
ncbi:hypothetical protein [Aquimarina agarivorans]|uniref:hypothetical protein n=1 Tax=Aquimarina agarivorans TaxID=980584 RepID=UPI000248EB76|nr:hypothetical protein [Aquimarina agarivorans]